MFKPFFSIYLKFEINYIYVVTLSSGADVFDWLQYQVYQVYLLHREINRLWF